MIKPNTTTLIYDRDVSGHHLDYLQFLVEYLVEAPASVRPFFVFVLNPEAQKRFAPYELMLRFHYLADSQVNSFETQQSVLKRAAAEFDLLTKLASHYQAKRLFFMHLDAFQIELGKAQHWNRGIETAGILFLPFRKQYENGTTTASRLKRAVRGLRKYQQVKWMLQNPNLKEVFFLNDQDGVTQYNERFGGFFAYLPDPIDQNLTVEASVETLKIKYQVPNERLIFLIYGHLSARKNIPNIMASLGGFSKERRSKISILVCGEPEKGYEQTLHASIDEAKKLHPEVAIVTHFQFFDPVLTNEVFKLADVVLVPYIHFFSSSNILGLAAKYHKPLIASKLGIMGQLVQQYQLGQIINPESQAEIKQAMEAHLNNTAPTINGRSYLEAHSNAVFCQKILKIEGIAHH
ncbi:MAG: glycosyltransferase [Runella slithyformis]|nr:MAG: glycosyltransferase [Runella slithyformis]